MQGNKIRVLIIPRPEPADAVTSGIGRYVGVLKKHLGPDVEVVHLPGAPHREDRQFFREAAKARGGQRIFRALVPESIRLILAYARDIRQLARQLRPYRNQVDLIHVNRVGCEIQTIAARLAGFRRIVATIHNLPGEDHAAQHWVRRLVERMSFASATRLIAVSQATFDAWRARIGLSADKVVTIHNGIEQPAGDSRDKDSERRKLGVPAGAFVFGICARLHPMKGHLVLLDAFARLLTEPAVAVESSCGERQLHVLRAPVERPILLIAGDGPEEDRIRGRIEELGLQERARMIGRIQDVQGFMAAIDVHVLPSVMLESMPFSVIEAMFAGIASIVSDVGGAKEIVVGADAGLVVPKGDVAALAGAMERCLRDPAFSNAAGQRGREYAETRLTGTTMARATEQIYRRVVGEVQ